MSELPAQEPLLEPLQELLLDPVEEDGNVAHPVPIDSPTTRDGDGGMPPDSLPPVLGD
ncbi:hypothetical protein OOK29_45975 [Streptomyces phaeochromogenes]|jgi:hypothetical protein|uniref:Uncharacterized protein n=1 Tax=Streptomyces phaeochromogenes TaxID=1923 RepID=A0ABZ1HDX2_STRPH|nr:hypothetical protein [Streptomyces phaeochromogenes]MCX5605492.1 hypothetical protein [Streptomyces phaeochromogenes]WRZ31210.1 hypothetical protein OG931_27420 [Streptomyces phaeochromogenes]WSD16799.1 hypothetical protein OHB35_28080 [Streptomyces phaeochromogenes]WSJ06379.1 hypothetical protein OG437_23385 [Streptomyces phaeochromogenes]